MYFAITPKEELKEFYNHRLEYRAICELVDEGKRPTISGTRFSGKTSIINIIEKEKGIRLEEKVKGDIRLDPLNNEMSMEFLRIGFKQAGRGYSYNELKGAVQRCGGNMGCLTLYGYIRAIAEYREPMKKLEVMMFEKVERDLKKIVKHSKAPEVYITILYESKGLSWGELERVLKKRLRDEINPGTIYRAINKLIEEGLIYRANKRYYSIPHTQTEYVLDL